MGLLGVANGLARELDGSGGECDGERSLCLCLPLFLTGENGLLVRAGAAVLTAFDLGRMDDEDVGAVDCLALLSFL